MKALLLYPQYPDTSWSFKYALPFISKRAVNPPLGLLTVAITYSIYGFHFRKVFKLNLMVSQKVAQRPFSSFRRKSESSKFN